MTEQEDEDREVCSWCGHPRGEHQDGYTECRNVSWSGEDGCNLRCGCPEFGWDGTSIIPGYNAVWDVR